MKYRCFFILLIFSTVSITSLSNHDSLTHVYTYSKNNNDRLHAGVLIAQDLMRTNRDSSLVLLTNAKALANESNSVIKADYFNAWGVYYWYDGDFEKAISKFKIVMELENNQGLMPKKAMAANNIGSLYNTSGLPDSARKYLNKALQIDTELGNEPGINKTKYDLSIMYLRQDKYVLALMYLLEVADYQQEKQDTFRLAHTYMVLGNTYSRLDSISKAINYHLKCVELFSAINEKYMLSLSYNNIASIYCSKPNKLDSTLYYAKKGLAIAEEEEYHNLLLILNTNIGIAHITNNRIEEAINWIAKAYEHVEMTNNMSAITNFYIRFGDAHSKAGNHKKAREYLNKGLELAISANYTGNQSQAYLLLSELDSIQGDKGSSLANYKAGIALRDSIWSKEHKSRLSELQIIYETEKKEYEIQALKRRQEANRLKLQIGILIVLVAGVLLLSVIIYLAKQRKISKQELLIQQKEAEKTQAVLNANMQELTGKALSLVKSEEVINKLKNELEEMVARPGESDSKNLNDLLRHLQSNNKSQELWKDFENRFNELNSGFISKLVKLHPELSPTEVRLCAMLRLQLTTKEISELTNRSVRTIETTRFNIRKKLSINCSGNLTNYILKL